MQSLKSNALEPTRGELDSLPPLARVAKRLPVFGLPILTLLLIVIFSIVLPDTFPTLLNLRSIIGDKSIIALLALAAMIPMATGRIDLTVGYGIVLWHILAISLQTMYGLDWWVSVLIVLALGALLGLLNGLLVEVAQIDSFIATLGTGTVLYALAMWHTGGRQIVGVLPDAFTAIFSTSLFGLPIVAAYVLCIAVVMWLAADYLPVGRYLYAIGANPRAAALNGIPTRRYVVLAFVTSGLLTAFAGVVLAAKLRIGQASVGLDYLLPALVGAFLGSTTIKPGRVNVWGTLFGISILAVGIAGIQQLGGEFYVEPLFNGATLLAAIGIAGYTQRRRRNPNRPAVPPRHQSQQPNSAPKSAASTDDTSRSSAITS
ncbi:ABC transporter permease [Pandoraea sp. ISTKB]|uniref:ABC transporter permease n=1 Tax=Pandoraea sp. ISTKB TaxID=1586708 RepID=UPI000846CC40|nr:ABC transporter permease [Pandoraea sp. ISTKB]ODP35728.1 ABC transporter permease [Pandoraea sp. ISTKB]